MNKVISNINDCSEIFKSDTESYKNGNYDFNNFNNLTCPPKSISKNMAKWIVEGIPQNTETINLISLGAGTGRCEQFIISELAQKAIKTKVYLLDYNRKSMNLLNKKIRDEIFDRELSQNLFDRKFIDICMVNCDIENSFKKISEIVSKCDLIIAFFLLHHIKEWKLLLNMIFLNCKNSSLICTATQTGEFACLDNNFYEVKKSLFSEFCRIYHEARSKIGKSWKRNPSASRQEVINNRIIKHGFEFSSKYFSGEWVTEVVGGVNTLLSLVSPTKKYTFAPLAYNLSVDEKIIIYNTLLEWANDKIAIYGNEPIYYTQGNIINLFAR